MQRHCLRYSDSSSTIGLVFEKITSEHFCFSRVKDYKYHDAPNSTVNSCRYRMLSPPNYAKLILPLFEKMTTDNSSDDLRGTAEIEIPSLGFWFQRNAEHPGFSQFVKEIEICVPDRLVCAEPGVGDKKLNKAHTQLLAHVKGPAPPLHDPRPLARETPETLENKYKTILMFLCDGLEAAQFTEQPGVDAPTRDRSGSGMPSIDSSTGGAIALLHVSDFYGEVERRCVNHSVVPEPGLKRSPV